MSHKAVKLGITALVIAAAFGGLLYASLGESAEYYKHVDEVMVSPQQWEGKKLQLHGYAHQIGRKPDTLDYRFDIENNGKVIRAYYSGIVPDTFKDEAEVVLTGQLTANGFMATDMTAKCPSKYEAAPTTGARTGG